jgi:hypothetical protein
MAYTFLSSTRSEPRPIDPAILLPRVSAKTLIALQTNSGYCDFSLNLVESIRRAGCTWSPVVFCLDEGSMKRMEAARLTCVRFFCKVSSHLETYGSERYKAIVLTKLEMLRSLLQTLGEYPRNVEYLFYLDSDLVVLKDPLPYLLAEAARPGSPTTFFQCGERASTCTNAAACKNCCTGLIFTKITQAAFDLFGIANVDPATTRLDGDQDSVNAKLRSLGRAYPHRTLPVPLFPNGYHRRRQLRDKFVLHYNYLFSHEKRLAMTAAGHWYSTPPERKAGRAPK